MVHYYVSRQLEDTGERDVHLTGCPIMPTETKRLYLGSHDSCQSALDEARKTYAKVNGCYRCCPECCTELL